MPKGKSEAELTDNEILSVSRLVISKEETVPVSCWSDDGLLPQSPLKRDVPTCSVRRWEEKNAYQQRRLGFSS